METTISKTQMEIFHEKFNLDKNHNLDSIPAAKAVFGIFGIVDEQPINCRYVAVAENLQAAIKDLYENPPGEGLKKFMQGPWIQMLKYEVLEGVEDGEIQKLKEEWENDYQPKIDEDGEYPGYYDY